MFLSLYSLYVIWHLTDVIIRIVFSQDDPDLSLEESTTLDATADIPAPERTLDCQQQGDNEDSYGERNRPTPSKSAKKRNKSEVNESMYFTSGPIFNTAGYANAASFGHLVVRHLVQIKSKTLRRNVKLDMLKFLYRVLEEEEALSERE